MTEFNKDFDKIPQEQFEFVQRGEKIYDKKFETKPIGYFKDAMIRFAKNKANVWASIILFSVIFLSIFVPIISDKNAETQESLLAYLPPRIPILENWGIADGYIYLESQTADITNIDEETGLALPFSIPEEYIDIDTLTNYYVSCTDSTDPLCVGGYNILSVDPGKERVVLETTSDEDSSDYFFLYMLEANNAYIEINISEVTLTDDAHVNIYLKASSFDTEYTLVETITEAGTFEIYPYEDLGVSSVTSQLLIEMVSDESTDTVYFESIEVYDDTQEEAIYSLSGYYMANYLQMVSYGDGVTAGTWGRTDGLVLVCDFDYDAYGYVFGSYDDIVAQSEFDALMVEWDSECTINWTNPDDSNNWTYDEGCPIEEVVGKVGYTVVNGVEYFSYDVVANYALMNGYDGIPYFLFGTNGSGKDMVKLIWIGTRTSLLLGVLVSVINVTVGIIYGSISGYYGGTVDLLMERFSEIVGRIPWLVTLSIVVSIYGPGQTALILTLVISGWIGTASITRTQFYRYKGREYVLASRTLGAKDRRLIFRHILPNGIGTIITSSILSIPYVIFTESTLSFLGYGIGFGMTLNLFGFELSGVSIGVLLAEGKSRLNYQPYLTLWPALIIAILMISFNMFGNALRDAFNPALRGTE
ncbi:MAG: ABC transporter permease [Sphaerochaetaceae bacterium]|nr:ABC transporter permease [Sphaerochaetaceae bacterium]